MKTKLGFLKNVRIAAIVVVFSIMACVFLLYTNATDVTSNNTTKNRIIDFSYGALEDDFQKEELLQRIQEISFYNKDHERYEKLKDVKDAQYLMKATVLPIKTDGTFMLLDAKSDAQNRIKVLTDEFEILPSPPIVAGYNGKSAYSYYMLPVSDEPYNIYIYFDENFTFSDLKSSIVFVGSQSELAKKKADGSVVNVVFVGILLLLGLFVYVVFYITSIQKYYTVRAFALSSILIAIQNIINMPFIGYIFKVDTLLYSQIKVISYFSLCILSFLIVIINIKNDKWKHFYMINMVFTFVFMLYVLIENGLQTTSDLKYQIGVLYNTYYILVYAISLIVCIYDAKNKKIGEVLKLSTYTTIVLLNLYFYNFQMSVTDVSLGSVHLFLLSTYTVSVILYIISIFYSRSLDIQRTKLLLDDEKETVNRLYRSNKNAITTKNLDELCQNILSDIKELYPDIVNVSIIHRDLEKNLSLQAQYGNIKGDEKKYINKIYKRRFARIKKSSYKSDFKGNKAYFIFRSSTGESILIAMKKKTQFSDLDIIAGKILASPILLTFNNCRIYDEIENTERALLYAMGDSTFKKAGGYGDVYRIGEYCYILAKNTGLTIEFAKSIRLASYIHNIGKVGMSDSLTNYDSVAKEDRGEFYKHATIGYEMLSKFSGETMYTASMCSLYHHENYDGTGYLGKKGSEIPIEARIVTICSEFDKSYDACFHREEEIINSNSINNDDIKIRNNSLDEAFAYLVDNKQTIFDPDLVQLFIKSVDEIKDVIDERNIQISEAIEKEAMFDKI